MSSGGQQHSGYCRHGNITRKCDLCSLIDLVRKVGKTRMVSPIDGYVLVDVDALDALQLACIEIDAQKEGE